MLRLFIFVVCCLVSISTANSQLGNQNTYLLRNIDTYTSYSAIWGYVAPNGREYAILGTNTGTSFVDITDSANIVEVDFVPGVVSNWREMKTYLQYAYVVSEGTNSALQIIDMSYLPDSVRLISTWSYSGYTKTHSISQSGPYLYLNGGNASPNGGVAIVDVTIPTSPVKLGQWTTEYVHDCRVLNDTIWTANVYSGRMSIINAANKNSPQYVRNWQAYQSVAISTHNAAITDDRKHILTTNEVQSPAGKLYVFDISDLDNITKITEWQPTGITGSIVHNVEIYGKYAVIAHYTAGIRIVDISNPASPVEVAWYDTYPSSNGNSFNGCWGVYVFPSGKIVGSDISNGLFVVKTNFPIRETESFTKTEFPPTFFQVQYGGGIYWSRQDVSAYGSGRGSAMFEFFSATQGTVQSLFTNCAPTKPGTYLTFDQAYAPYGQSFPGPDSLYVESSTNGGTTYTVLAALAGVYPSGGDLNTAPATISPFVPTASQWRPKIYSLPVGTNKVRLRARSGYGNNLYIDNFSIRQLPASTTTSVGLLSQAMYIPSVPYWRFLDTVTVYLHRADFPNIAVDSARVPMSNSSFTMPLIFQKALSGTYYTVLRHRNSLATWSSVTRNLTRGSAFANYSFFHPSGQAYGNNQIQVSSSPNHWAIYSGDINQDKIIDGSDLGFIDNDASVYLSGFVITDLTGDFFVDGTDFSFADNNASSYVSAIEPPGASLSPVPEEFADASPEFKSPEIRMKYEQGKRERLNQETSSKKSISYKEFLEMKKKEYSGRQ